MPVLPVLSGREVVRVFEKFGWPAQIATLSVPDHREVAKGTLRSLIRAAGLTVEVFVAEAEKL
jgi:predicted RNA binding protein YcfA (HicA-like mRNA interferase family)